MSDDKGMRFNDGKAKWHLVDFDSLEVMVKVLEYGATKYPEDNWKKGLNPTEVLESLQRHLISLFNGEQIDKESKLPHIGHVLCNAMFFSYLTRKKD